MKRQTVAFLPLGCVNNLVDSDEVMREAINQTSSGTGKPAVSSGCPGKRYEEFEALLAFVKAFRSDAPGVFASWLEPNMPAGQASGQLPVRSANTTRQFPLWVLGA